MYEDKEYDILMEADKKAKEKGTILGRYINESIADGYAYYEITKVNKKTVVIEHVFIGDGYSVSYWGAKATIDIAYATASVKGRDAMAKIFGKSST